MKRLHVNWVLSELSLGQIWDVDLQKNEMVVKDVLLVAQGEMALEEFLKQVSIRHGSNTNMGFLSQLFAFSDTTRTIFITRVFNKLVCIWQFKGLVHPKIRLCFTHPRGILGV